MSTTTIPRWDSCTTTNDGPWATHAFAPWPGNGHYEKLVSKPTARHIVDNDHEAWAQVPETSSTLNCYRPYSHGRRGNLFVEARHPCDTWSCEDCAIQKVVRHLGHLHHVFHQLEGIFVMTLSDVNDATLRKQLERGRQRPTLVDEDPEPNWRVIVKRADDHMMYVYATGEPRGGLARFGKWIDPLEAFEHARCIALRLPGLEHVPTYSRNGGPPEPHVGSTYVAYTRGLNAERSAQFNDEKERSAKRLYDRRFDALLRDQMDAAAEETKRRLGM